MELYLLLVFFKFRILCAIWNMKFCQYEKFRILTILVEKGRKTNVMKIERHEPETGGLKKISKFFKRNNVLGLNHYIDLRNIIAAVALVCILSFAQMSYAGGTDVPCAAVQEPENPIEQVKLGMKLLEDSVKMPKDQPRAVRLFAMSAEKGNAEGQYQLGRCYGNGWGIKKDYEKAVEWIEKSAEQNCVDAQECLGDCYFTGTGVDKDGKRAFLWYSRAAEKGNSRAQLKLAGYYIKGCDGIGENIEKAIQLLESAADKNNQFCQNILAAGFATGYIIYKKSKSDFYIVPVERNPDKAIKYAEQRLKLGCRALTRSVLFSIIALSYQLKGEWREAIRILMNTPAKYLFLGLLLAYLAELVVLLWVIRKSRNSGMSTATSWRLGDIFILAGLFII